MEVRLTTTPLPEHLQEFADYRDPICTESIEKKRLHNSIKIHNNDLRKQAEKLGCNWVVGIVYTRLPEDESDYALTFATGTPVYVDI